MSLAVLLRPHHRVALPRAAGRGAGSGAFHSNICGHLFHLRQPTSWPRGAWLVFCLLSLRQAQLLEDMQKRKRKTILQMTRVHAYNHAGKLLHVCSKSIGNYWMGSDHAPARTGNYSTPTRKLLQHALKTLGILWTACAHACLGQTCDK